ncbi:hypothetical protein [Lysobacter sp. P5_B9]
MDKFSFERRDQLDALIDSFEQCLSRLLDELVAYCNGHANSILSVTGEDDDQYVCNRINAVLRKHAFPLYAIHLLERRRTSSRPLPRFGEGD